MDKTTLIELLAEASGRRAKNGSFEFNAEDQASLMLGTGGPMLLIEEVGRVEVKDGFAMVRAGRADLFVVSLDRILGVRLQRSKREGAGFVAG